MDWDTLDALEGRCIGTEDERNDEWQIDEVYHPVIRRISEEMGI